MAIDAEDAERFTEHLGHIVAGAVGLMDWGSEHGIAHALGMSDEEWAQRKVFGPVKLSRQERRIIVAAKTAAGFSQRQIAAVVGVDAATVNRDIAVANATEDEEAPHYDADFVPPSVANATPDDTPDDSLWWDKEPKDAEPPRPKQPEEPKQPHVGHNSGDHEWYTPPEYIAAVRTVLGEIDLDPASSPEANEVVQAATFYTVEQNGLVLPWHGRVWMNPPYMQPAVDRFCTRLAREFRDGAVTEAMAGERMAIDTARRTLAVTTREDRMNTTIRIPETIEAAQAALGELGRLLTAKGWERAAIIYAFTYEPRQENITGRKTDSLSADEFANLGLNGLTHKDTVYRHRRNWQHAIDDGWAGTSACRSTIAARPSRNWPMRDCLSAKSRAL